MEGQLQLTGAGAGVSAPSKDHSPLPALSQGVMSQRALGTSGPPGGYLP